MSPHKKGYPGYDTKLDLVNKLQFWNFVMYGVAVYYYFSQILLDLDELSLLRTNLWIK